MFIDMVENLLNRHEPEGQSPQVTMAQYETWQKYYSFDALYNLRYGQSFCNEFNIRDNILFYEQNWVRADTYIRNNYIVRP